MQSGVRGTSCKWINVRNITFIKMLLFDRDLHNLSGGANLHDSKIRRKNIAQRSRASSDVPCESRTDGSHRQNYAYTIVRARRFPTFASRANPYLFLERARFRYVCINKNLFISLIARFSSTVAYIFAPDNFVF